MQFIGAKFYNTGDNNLLLFAMTYSWMQLKKDNNDNRDLKIKVFWQFPPTANVKRFRDLLSSLRIEVLVCTASPCSQGK